MPLWIAECKSSTISAPSNAKGALQHHQDAPQGMLQPSHHRAFRTHAPVCCENRTFAQSVHLSRQKLFSRVREELVYRPPPRCAHMMHRQHDLTDIEKRLDNPNKSITYGVVRVGMRTQVFECANIPISLEISECLRALRDLFVQKFLFKCSHGSVRLCASSCPR